MAKKSSSKFLLKVKFLLNKMAMIVFNIRHVGFYLLAFATVWEPSASQTPEEGFNYFLHLSIINYHDWAVENGLEPLRVPELLNLTENRGTIEYTCGMRNHVIHGLSESVHETQQIDSSLIRGYFQISYYTTPTFFVGGEYSIKGSVFSTIPITGSGNFRSNSTQRVEVYGFRLANFRVINDHIDISEAEISYPSLYLGNTGLEFDGLQAGGYESSVSEMVEENYRNGRYWMEEAMVENFKKYFEFVFAETPVSELIGTTMPPSITTLEPTYPPTTTERIVEPTTDFNTKDPCCWVCPCNKNYKNQSQITLKEDIVESKIIMEDGKMVKYGKKLVEFKEEL